MAGLFALLMLLGAACGSDDGSEGDGDETAGADRGSGLPEGCTEPPYELEWRLEGDGPRDEVTIDDAVAIEGFDGGAWTLILTDDEIPRDHDWLTAVGFPDFPPDALVFQAGIFVRTSVDQATVEPVEVGETVVAQESDTRMVAASVVQGAEPTGSVDKVEEATLLYADDETVCIEFAITSESGDEFVGTATAEIVASE